MDSLVNCLVSFHNYWLLPNQLTADFVVKDVPLQLNMIADWSERDIICYLKSVIENGKKLRKPADAIDKYDYRTIKDIISDGWQIAHVTKSRSLILGQGSSYKTQCLINTEYLNNKL